MAAKDMPPSNPLQAAHGIGAPLQVYLDSQDFSRFSRCSTEYSRFLPVRQRLLEMRDQGHIRFPFSDIHIAECLPTDPSNPKGGKDRIETIAEFSQGNCLPNSGALIDFEVQTLLATRRRSRKRPRLTAEWFAHVDLAHDAMARARGSAHRNLKTEFDLNRRNRRYLLKLSNRDAQAMTDDAFASCGLDDFMALWPFRVEDRARLLRALRSPGSHVAVGDALRDGLRDIVNFSHWVVCHWDSHGKAFVENLRKPAAEVLRAFTYLFEKLQPLHLEYTDKEAKNQRSDKLRQILDQARDDWFVSFPSALAERSLGLRPPPDGFDIRIDEGLSPSLFAMLHFLVELTAEASRIERPRDPRSKAANDFADALHVLYLPRVDVFRTDRFACSILERSAKGKETRIAPSLQTLPELLEKTLEARALASA